MERRKQFSFFVPLSTDHLVGQITGFELRPMSDVLRELISAINSGNAWPMPKMPATSYPSE